MKKGITVFARAVVFLVGITALAVLAILIPELAREEAVGKPFNPYVTYGFFAAVYIISIPFFIALWQTLKLLNYIDKGKAFSNRSIKALQNIKVCAIVFAVSIVIATIAGIALAKIMDPREDVTFMVPIGFAFTFIPSVIAVFIAVLQKLLADAMELKSENDLIV